MPRPKRKATDVDSSLCSGPKKSTSKQLDRIDHLFESYTNKSLGLIDPEGIEALCKDVHVDHTDVRMLILAWKMKAEKQGYFSKDEWRRGLKCLGADTLTKLRKAIKGLNQEVMVPECFEGFYSYSFQYCLTEKQRSVDIETICELLNIVLGSEFPSQVKSLIEYLKIQTDYRALTMDHWRNIYRFFKEVSFVDLQSYDSSQAWPVILDNFVEWLKGKEEKN
ncbi:PREDICTED: DCN1-like protein 5 isoform X2 [Lupinus angustifolius]|uniref:DCN1-like protein 5 isoform X2 n=1 Tax=Lupinus angustifolius TaxID=3871 RepID=UPI00092F4197|nr:PREDICTED: DCN1-like protein 5 isoform X2 [Lupinus angustifolius]